MGCNCKATSKGIANRASEKWLVQDVYELYKIEIGETRIQYFTKEQRDLVLDWYDEIYPNSIPVEYKKANNELIKLFQFHKLI